MVKKAERLYKSSNMNDVFIGSGYVDDEEEFHISLTTGSDDDRRREELLFLDYIHFLNKKIEASPPVLIYIAYNSQAPTAQAGNAYFAKRCIISDNDAKELLMSFIRDRLISGGGRYPATVTKEIIDEALEERYFSGTPWGLEHNMCHKYQILHSVVKDIIFWDECNIFSLAKLTEVEDGFEFIRDDAVFTEDNRVRGETYTFKDEDEKDIYRSALLDGCSPAQAYALLFGVDLTGDDEAPVPYTPGYYQMKDEVVAYFPFLKPRIRHVR